MRNVLIRDYLAKHPMHDHQFLIGTRWLMATDELPDDELDRVLKDPRRPTAGDEIRDMGDGE